MDCTNFEFHSFHDRQPDIDHRREIIRSIAATAVFLAALSIAAIILAIQIGPANACATTESMPAANINPE